MIIGISGKKNSGKDLIGKIIQYLVFKAFFPEDTFCKTFINYTKQYTNLNDTTIWKTIKFADKLKNIVCLLIDCTRKQLEDKDFKNKELPEKWWIFKTPEGIKSYKDNIALVNHFDLIKLTPRKLLQSIGTDLFRNQLHPNIWVNATFANYLPPPDINSTTQWQESNWLITDVRFPNEVQAIKDRDGLLIRVNRIYPEDQFGFNGTVNHLRHIAPQHKSETALDNFKDWDIIINNDSTIEDLILKVKDFLIMKKII